MNRFLRPSLFFAAALLLAGVFSSNQTAFAQIANGQLLISEFRFRGPDPDGAATNASGASDEFVEIYNNTDTALDIGGVALVSLQSSGNGTTLLATVPTGTIIPARGHYLFTNSATSGGYSLGSYASANQTYGTGISDNTGVALCRTSTLTNCTGGPGASTSNGTGADRLDSVGFVQTGTTTQTARPFFIEGTALPLGPGATITDAADQISYVRRIAAGLPQDTNNNASDFILVSVTGNYTTGLNPSVDTAVTLGAPGPENLSSPIVRNATIKSRLLEPTLASTASPNRVRTGTGNSGTVSFRRTLRNNTGQTINSFRFRVNDLSTLNNDEGDTTRAILALTDSIEFTYDPDDNPATANTQVLGTTLEAPATTNPGGGINASLRVNLPSGVTVASGSSFSVNITFNIIRAGNYRFSLNHEAVLEPVATATPFTKTAESSK